MSTSLEWIKMKKEKDIAIVFEFLGDRDSDQEYGSSEENEKDA